MRVSRYLTIPAAVAAFAAARLILTALIAVVLHVGLPVHPSSDDPACQVHVWDGNPPYGCHEPQAEGDDA